MPPTLDRTCCPPGRRPLLDDAGQAPHREAGREPNAVPAAQLAPRQVQDQLRLLRLLQLDRHASQI